MSPAIPRSVLQAPELGILRLVPASEVPLTALENPVDIDITGRVVDRTRRHAASRPDRTAVIAGKSVISYRSLAEAVDAAVAALRGAGCATGDVVACLGRRSADTVVLFLALEEIGAVYLPVDPEWPDTRIAEVLRRSAAAFVVDYTAGDPNARTITALTDRVGRPEGTAVEAAGPTPRYVIFTSGTTGRPKGAVVEQSGMMNHLWAKILDLDLTENDRVAFTAPLVFDISIWQLAAPLLIGATIVVATEDDVLFPTRLQRLLIRHEVSVAELVPTAIGNLLDETERRSAEWVFPALRWLISTGEELRPGLADRVLAGLPQAELLNAYGPTECSDDVTHHTVTASDTAGPRLPIGVPVANVKLYCLRPGPEDGTWTPAAPGEVGEIFVGGIAVGLGYLGDPDATRDAFFHDVLDPTSPTGRLYRTGDLGRVDNGVLHYLGRIDRQVKVGGVRMELDEIEAVLSRHPDVAGCAVAAIGENGARKVLTAFVVTRSAVSCEHLETFVRTRLPIDMVPKRWKRLDVMPLTANGKVDHRALTATVSDRNPLAQGEP